MNYEIESAKDLTLRSQGMKVAVFKNNKEIQMLTQKSSSNKTQTNNPEIKNTTNPRDRGAMLL